MVACDAAIAGDAVLVVVTVAGVAVAVAVVVLMVDMVAYGLAIWLVAICSASMVSLDHISSRC